MVRVILFILLFVPVQAGAFGVMLGSHHVETGGAGDSCTGTLLFSAHMENDDDVTVGTPAGCVVSGGDNTITRTGVTYSATEKSDGTYSAYSAVENSKMVIDSTNMDISITGTWCADVYYTQTATRQVFLLNAAAGPQGKITYVAGANTLLAGYGTENYVGTDTFDQGSVDGFTRVCYSWDASGGVGADSLGTKVGANAWEESTTKTLTALGANPATYNLGPTSFQYWPGYVDNLKLYSDYGHDE